MTEEEKAAEAEKAAQANPPVVDPPVEKTDDPPVVDPAEEKVQARINKMAVQKNSAENRAEIAEKKLADLEAAPSVAPKLGDEDIGYDEEKFRAAEIKHEVSRQMGEQEIETQKNATEATRQEESNKYFAAQEEYIKDHPDFMDGVNKLPVLPPDTLAAVQNLGPQMVHYLGKNLDVAGEIASASFGDAAVRLGQISMGLSANKIVVKTSNAPEPVETLSGKSAVTKDYKDMTTAEVMACPDL